MQVSLRGDRCLINRLRFALVDVNDGDNDSRSVLPDVKRTLPSTEIAVNEQTGELCVTAPLDYESIQFYSLHVSAISTSGIAPENIHLFVRLDSIVKR